jgi:hypothetical protein
VRGNIQRQQFPAETGEHEGIEDCVMIANNRRGNISAYLARDIKLNGLDANVLRTRHDERFGERKRRLVGEEEEEDKEKKRWKRSRERRRGCGDIL